MVNPKTIGILLTEAAKFGAVRTFKCADFEVEFHQPAAATPPLVPDNSEEERALAGEHARAAEPHDPLADPDSNPHGVALSGFVKIEKPEGYDEEE